jgi:methylated-DNA-protein-cysteine methyltransferase related protein
MNTRILLPQSPGVWHRRTAMNERWSAIWEAVEAIPQGRVASYGQVAEAAGLPGRARLVGRALAGLPPESDVPWHRVVNARGEISLTGPAAATQRRLLRAEGVAFLAGGRIDMRRFGPG